jgi:site-specific recombinase XerD
MTASASVKVQVPYVHSDTDRHGNVRYYYRRRPGAPKIRIRARIGTPDFVEQYREACLSGSESTPSLPRIRPGTWGWLCTRYFNSSEFTLLAKTTQAERRAILSSTFDEAIAPGASEKFMDFPLNRMTPKAIRVLRDRKSATPEAANARVKVMRRVFAWGIDNDWCHTNPARDVQRIKNVSDGHRTWTPEDIAQFEARHPIGSKARLALALLLYTGARRSDVVLLGRQHVRDGWLKFTQQKNRRRKLVVIELPILPVLQSILQRSPTGDLAFLVNVHGRPFSADGFSSWFKDQCVAASLNDHNAHGLRKAGAVLAAENGATPHQLMAIFGWLSISEAQRYTQAAQRKKMAADAMRLLDRTRPQQASDDAGAGA